MSKQGASNSPTSFFRGISSRLSSQYAHGQPEWSSATSQQQPQQQQQQQQSAPAAAGNGGGAIYNPFMGQVTTSLMTQAVQQSPPQRSGVGAGGGSSQPRRNLAMSPAGVAAQGQQQQQQQQRVHASALIERVRLIRNELKNTSPINPLLHPTLLPPTQPHLRGRKCLILDVDETLVHSSYENTGRYDHHLAVPTDDGAVINVYVSYRPYLQEFLEAIAPLFEVVIFTASLAQYCNPLMDAVDPNGILGDLRLFREHCSLVSSTFVKDLSLLGRPLDHVAIIDNSPPAYLFQQRNAIPILSWFDDPNDCELRRLIPVLEAVAEAQTVYDVLDNYNALLQLQQLEEQDAHRE